MTIFRRSAGLHVYLERVVETRFCLRAPTMPILRLLLGRPRMAFFSAAAAFFGGILFLTWVGTVDENGRESARVGADKQKEGGHRWRTVKIIQACQREQPTKLSKFPRSRLLSGPGPRSTTVVHSMSFIHTCLQAAYREVYT
jgi:hypothetical protein